VCKSRQLFLHPLLIVALFSLPICLAAVPLEFTAFGPRKWNRSALRVGWTGTAPAKLTPAELDSTVKQAFDRWSGASGLRFALDSTFQRGEIETRPVLDALSFDIDVMVVFTNSYETLIAANPPKLDKDLALVTKKTLAVTYDTAGTRSLNMREKVVILVDNALATRQPALLETLVHEAGHSIGMGHSAINWPGLPLPSARPVVPFMTPLDFPLIPPLHPDDSASAALIYGNSAYGTIAGRVKDSKGRGINGVQVLALPVDANDQIPAALPTERNIVATITPFGRLQSTSTVEPPDTKGLYKIALQNGRYKLVVELIRIGFTPSHVPRNLSSRVVGESQPFSIAPGQVLRDRDIVVVLTP